MGSLIYCTVTSIVCMFTHCTVFHRYACTKISNGSNVRAIAVLTKPSVVSNNCISLASKLLRQFFKKGILLDFLLKPLAQLQDYLHNSTSLILTLHNLLLPSDLQLITIRCCQPLSFYFPI